MTDQAPSPIRWLARVALPLAIAFAAPAAASPASDRAAILHRVAAMEAAWNRGDFRGYMTGFQNPGVVFVSGGKFTEGVNTRLFRKVRGRWLISVNHVSAYDVPPTAPEAAPGRPSN